MALNTVPHNHEPFEQLFNPVLLEELAEKATQAGLDISLQLARHFAEPMWTFHRPPEMGDEEYALFLDELHEAKEFGDLPPRGVTVRPRCERCRQDAFDLERALAQAEVPSA